jgi:hypothetical protein
VDAILPVVTLIIGYLGTMLTEQVRDHRAEQREKKRLRADFQRDTLIRLQDAIQRNFAIHAQLELSRQNHYRDFGVWAQTNLEERDAEELELRMIMVALAPRVDDQEIRRLVRELRSIIPDILVAPSSAESMRLVGSAGNVFRELMDRFGEVLRTL